MIPRLHTLLVGDGMKARAIRGTVMSVMGFGGAQFIRLASNLILTRILFPEAFGLMALVQVLLTGLEMFSDLGISQSIIQNPRGDEDKFLNTAWTLQIIRGGVLWVVACALAIPVARFYGQDALIGIIPILGLTTVISGFRSTRMPLANRHVRLGRMTTIELVSQTLGTILMILLALWFETVWALVFGSLLSSFFLTVFSHVFLPGPPNRIGWDKEAFQDIFHFGKYIFFGTIAGFFVQNGDRVILGKYISLEDLAIYTIALMFASLPQMLSLQLAFRVILPLYRNRPPADSPSNRIQIGRALALLRFSFLGLATVLALGGTFLINFLYDARYASAGPLLVLLSLSIIPRLVIMTYDKILLANGNSRDFTIVMTGGAALRIGMLLVLVSQFGVVGAVIALPLVDVIIYPLLIWFIRPYQGWYPFQDLGFIMLAAMIAAIALWASPEALDLLRFSGAVPG